MTSMNAHIFLRWFARAVFVALLLGNDPIRSVQVDVGVILDNIHASKFLVSGLVYDVTTGFVQTVVPPTPLRLVG